MTSQTNIKALVVSNSSPASRHQLSTLVAELLDGWETKWLPSNVHRKPRDKLSFFSLPSFAPPRLNLKLYRSHI